MKSEEKPRPSVGAEHLASALGDAGRGSVTRLAAQLGCSRSHLANMIAGRRQPGPELLDAIQKKLKINRRWFETPRK